MDNRGLHCEFFIFFFLFYLRIVYYFVGFDKDFF